MELQKITRELINLSEDMFSTLSKYPFSVAEKLIELKKEFAKLEEDEIKDVKEPVKEKVVENISKTEKLNFDNELI